MPAAGSGVCRPAAGSPVLVVKINQKGNHPDLGPATMGQMQIVPSHEKGIHRKAESWECDSALPWEAVRALYRGHSFDRFWEFSKSETGVVSV